MSNSSYVWLPLLPREDGLGYSLLDLEEWRPRDFAAQVRQAPCHALPRFTILGPARQDPAFPDAPLFQPHASWFSLLEEVWISCKWPGRPPTENLT